MKNKWWLIIIILLTFAKVANAVRQYYALRPAAQSVVVASPIFTKARPTPYPTRTPAPTRAVDNCNWWYDLRESNVGDKLCVRGMVAEITGNDAYSRNTRIHFRSGLPDGYEWADGTPSRFYFFDQNYYYSDLKEEDCVSATGAISINQDGVLFMRIDGNLQQCP